MSACPRNSRFTIRTIQAIKGGQPESVESQILSHHQVDMSGNCRKENMFQHAKNFSNNHQRQSAFHPTTVQAQSSWESLKEKGKKLHRSKRNKNTIAPASYTAALDMVSKTNSDTLTIPSMRTGTVMEEAILKPRPRLKRTVSFVTGLSDLGDAKRRLIMDEQISIMESQFAECSVAPKSTINVVWTPISGKGTLTRNIGSVLGTSATNASPSTCSTISTVPPARTLHAGTALGIHMMFE